MIHQAVEFQSIEIVSACCIKARILQRCYRFHSVPKPPSTITPFVFSSHHDWHVFHAHSLSLGVSLSMFSSSTVLLCSRSERDRKSEIHNSLEQKDPSLLFRILFLWSTTSHAHSNLNLFLVLLTPLQDCNSEYLRSFYSMTTCSDRSRIIVKGWQLPSCSKIRKRNTSKTLLIDINRRTFINLAITPLHTLLRVESED